MKKIIYLVVVVCFGFTSCQQDDRESELNEELQKVLEDAGEGQGYSYFLLPDASDYNSIPQDPNNQLTKEKVELGKLLFHETAFGTIGKFPITVKEYSCASCHHAGAGFQSGLAQGLGEGGEGFGLMGEGRTRNQLCASELCDVQPLRSPTVLNGAYQPLMLWTGQFGATSFNIGTEDQWTPETPKETNMLGFEGLETQAIAGLTVHRMEYDKESVTNNGYKSMFDNVFGNVEVASRYSTVNAGLAIAAYERTLTAYNAPFQKYLRGNQYAIPDFQKEGAILFFGKANCSTCHTGPALNKMEFHALGLDEFDQSIVTHYNPEDPAKFGRAMFTGKENDRYKFKTPQLYNLKDVNFLGHGASIRSIKEMVDYKNNGTPENNSVPLSQISDEFKPLGLTDLEVEKVVAFIKYSLYDPNLDRFVPSSLPSGACFPNNDDQSREDLDCD
ncbi:MAG: cytochrome c peroxidase [Saprospiraceae bacterium]|jgi:cytochrome c peroxidase